MNRVRTTFRALALLFIAALLCASSCRAAIVYVNKNAPEPIHDGATWATACLTVQQGIDAAVAGDEVWVAAGTYQENLVIRNGKSLYGGFIGVETQRGQRDWTRNLTILDGAGKDRVVTIIAGTGSAQSVTIDGFTIEKGSALSGTGGGLTVFGDATIANNRIIGNYAVSNGHGYGGGIAAQGDTELIVNNIVVGNLSDVGGGVYCAARRTTVENCTVASNRATQGGAVYCDGTGATAVVNCLIANNNSGIFLSSSGVTLRSTDVYANTSYNFSGLTDPTGTNGNLSVDPMLSSFSSGSHLQPGSPCIDAGDDSVVTPSSTDLYGKPRIIGPHVDMGADESDGTLYPPPPARIWRVAPTGDDASDGTTWATAKGSVGLTLLLAQAGDEVWVAAGTYPCVGSLRSGVGLYGGFAGTETARSQRNPKTNSTILDGTIRKTSPKSAWTVISIGPDASNTTIIDGFTIQNGDSANGSGVYISGGFPTISNNTFSGNGLSALEWDTSVVIKGGGIYVEAGSPIITGNPFIGNGATQGAGIYVAQGTPAISINAITGNSSVTYGGGICGGGGTPLITGNTITGNRATYGGGIFASAGLIRDNVITSNQAGPDAKRSGAGGGLYLDAGAVAVHNWIFNNTTAGSLPGGGGAAVAGLLIDNVLQDNTGDSAAAVVPYNTGMVTRNTITVSASHYSASQIGLYGGTFTDNLTVSKSGGGVYVNSATYPALIANNTFVNVGPTQDGTALRYGILSFYATGQPIVSNNILIGYAKAGATWSNGGTAPVFITDHNDLYGNTDNTLALAGASPIGVNGNISADPLFLNAASGDYRLQAGSPCIDAGNDAYIGQGDRDLAGAPRIYGAHVDIGAYEYGSPLYTVLDAAEVLRVAAGISIATPEDVTRLHVLPEPSGEARITVADATLIAKWLLE